jgi:hypothetical protein
MGQSRKTHWVNYRIDEALRDTFYRACKANGVTQSHVMRTMMLNYIRSRAANHSSQGQPVHPANRFTPQMVPGYQYDPDTHVWNPIGEGL